MNWLQPSIRLHDKANILASIKLAEENSIVEVTIRNYRSPNIKNNTSIRNLRIFGVAKDPQSVRVGPLLTFDCWEKLKRFLTSFSSNVILSPWKINGTLYSLVLFLSFSVYVVFSMHHWIFFFLSFQLRLI